ncbi:MAG: sensor histidine kinase [Phycisphaerae bacterium]|jgi:signal transduction histidine kinase
MSTLSDPMTQRERELGAIISAYNDVTEQLKAAHERLREEVHRLRDELARKNRQLRRRERLAALGELAAGVAHEIRNPLGGIRLLASLLEKDLKDRPEALRLTGKIVKGVGRLETIVNDILQFGRPVDPSPGPVSLEQVLRESVELAEARAEPTSVKITLACRLKDAELHTDGAMLQRAVLNLLLNAVDAAAGRPEPTVWLEARAGTIGRVVISVSDNGPGIGADLMDRIFNPFFTTKDSGTGLGLAIVHRIAEALGGSVQAANRREGGAVFTLSLPRRLETADDRLRMAE